MTMRLSTGMCNWLAQHGSVKQAFENGEIKIYTGSQPATADAAATGTLLCTVTTGSGARTAEVLATGTVTLTGGAAGSVDSVTVDGIELLAAAVPYNTSLDQTASDLATAINQGISSPEYRASAAGAVVTIEALRGSGAAPNGFVVTGSNTTITTAYANMSGGVTAVNGLRWGNVAVGVIDKRASDAWSGVNVASGTAGWYRLYGSVADAGTLDSTGVTLRQDGAIAASGAELNIGTTFTNGVTTTISSLANTVPAS